MSKTQSSQTQQNPTSQGALPSSEPLAAMFDLWARMTRDGSTRLQALGDEWLAAETAAYERAKGATDEVARLFTDSIDYGARLATEWRKLGLETARRGVELMEVKS